MNVISTHRRGTLGAEQVHGRVLELTEVETGIVRLGQQHGAMKFALAIGVRGPAIDVARIEAALALLQRRHPVARCRLCEHGEPPRLRIEEHESHRIPVTHIEGRDWLSHWCEIEKQPLQDGSGAALLQVCMFTAAASEQAGAPQLGELETTLLVVFNHAFSDGVSAAALADELLELIEWLEQPERDAPRPPLPWAPTYVTALDDTLKTGLRSRARVGMQIAGVIWAELTKPRNVVTFPIADPTIAAHEISARSTTVHVSERLSRDASAALFAACRARGVTVGAAIGALLLDACNELTFARPPANAAAGDLLRLTTVVDMRKRYADPLAPAQLGFHVSSLAPITTKVADAPRSAAELWALAEYVGRESLAQLERKLDLARGRLLAQHWKSENSYYDETIVLSNWGVLPLRPSYGAWSLEFATPAMNMTHMRLPTVALSTCNQQLGFVIFVACPAVALTDVEALRVAMLERVAMLSVATRESI